MQSGEPAEQSRGAVVAPNTTSTTVGSRVTNVVPASTIGGALKGTVRTSSASAISHVSRKSLHQVIPSDVIRETSAELGVQSGALNELKSTSTTKSPQVREMLRELAEGKLSPRFLVARIVATPFFDYSTTFFVALNAITIGWQTDWEVSHIGEATPQTFKHIEIVFCCIFSLELFMRIYVQRCQFFKLVSGWKWNLFDSLVVAMQILDLVFDSIVGSRSQNTGDVSKKFSFIRILRILRLVRIIRVVRILRFIRELRMMVCSIANSLRSLMWTVILIFLMIYVVSVYLTQLVSDHGRDNPETMGEEMPLRERYGSLWQSILSLFQAMSGGVDWEDLSTPLIDNISPILGIVFTAYMAFAVLAMMNVVTAVFIESALLRAKEDKESELGYHMRNMMSKVDTDCSGMISWQAFQYLMSDAKMQRNFRALELDISEAKGLFNLLDIEGNGMISAQEFVSCCLQLRGPAKAIDVATLLYHNRRMSMRWKAHSRHVEGALDEIMEILCSSQSASARNTHQKSASVLSTHSMANFATWEDIKLKHQEVRELS